MVRCPACSTENPPDSRFCNVCCTRLTTSAPAAVTEERKVITALFCDLVGFTATSEGADPEDVDRMLTRYFQTARSQIELHGGVVEKFIGDAVVGVFGVPLAHGDDPERAVRAALRIADDAAGLQALKGAPLRLRIGINTGEASSGLISRPGQGSGSWPVTASTQPRGSSRLRRSSVWRSARRPGGQRAISSSTTSCRRPS
jgi:hypothetical protein